MGSDTQQIPKTAGSTDLQYCVASLRLISNTDADLLVLWHGYSVKEKLDNTSTVTLPRLIWEPT